MTWTFRFRLINPPPGFFGIAPKNPVLHTPISSTMVLSYSAMARPAEDAQKTIDISSSSFQPPMAQAPVSPSSTPNPLPSASSSQSTNLNHLILDAGPLLALRPLRYLATTFHTTPLVLAELRDPKAREHWERLGLSGVDVKVETPNVESMAKGS